MYADAICIELESIYRELNKEREETRNDLMIRMSELIRNKEKLGEKCFINEEMSKEIFKRLSVKFREEQQLIQKEMECSTISISNLKEILQETVFICIIPLEY